MQATKTRFISLLFALATLGLARAADDYPSKPIRLIAPVTAGSGLDVRVRYFAQALGQAFPAHAP